MLKSTLAAVAAVFAISAFSPAMAAKGDPHVLLTTSAGNIELELNSQKAPISVDNFLKYVNSGFYNNTTFHRVIPGFMVQGGGFNEQMQQKQPNPPIKNEADNGLRNTRGTIAMPPIRTAPPASSLSILRITPSSIMASVILAMRCLVKSLKVWTWRIRFLRCRPITLARIRMYRPNLS